MTAPAGPDCERRRPGLLAEPVNSLSSLAFLPGAAVLAVRAQRAGGGDATSDRLVAAALAANGLGSAWYHARFGTLSRWSHDWAMAALLWLLAAGRAGPAARRRLEVGGLAATAITHAALPASGPVVQVVVAATSAAALVGSGWRRPPGAPGGQRVALAGVASIAGAACYAAGRTGSRCCRPDSRLQLHAAWHVLVAVAATALALDLADVRS
jgi:hypothetical protein